MNTQRVIFLIDDDTDFSKEFAQLSITYRIGTIHKTNYRDMVKDLPLLSGKLSCIVLDINCLIEPNQEVEREDFLGKAISYLDQNYKSLPRVILTAVPSGYDDVKKYFANEKVYMKTKNDIIAMLQYIDGLDIESEKIRSLYSDVFEILERSLNTNEIETQLLSLIKKSDSKDYSEIVDCLAKIRRIQESIFQNINKTNKEILPDSVFKENKDLKFWDIHKHLQGNPSRDTNYKAITKVYYSGLIADFSEMLYKISSDNGSHNPSENHGYNPTAYSVKSLMNALMDFIRWFGTLNIK